MQGDYKEWKSLMDVRKIVQKKLAKVVNMQREDRSSYIVRKMQEDRKSIALEFQFRQVGLEGENRILRNMVKELQEQLQTAYIRIGELNKIKQLELNLDA